MMMRMLNLRSAALAFFFVLLHVIGVCVDLVDAAVSCPPPGEKAEDWVDCVGGFVVDHVSDTCFKNGGTCKIGTGECITGGTVKSAGACNTNEGDIFDNFNNCITGGTEDASLTCVSCETACLDLTSSGSVPCCVGTATCLYTNAWGCMSCGMLHGSSSFSIRIRM